MNLKRLNAFAGSDIAPELLFFLGLIEPVSGLIVGV